MGTQKTGRRTQKIKKYTGAEVGIAFLVEFIEVYKGKEQSIIPDEERAKMVDSLSKEESRIYQKYRNIYLHFLNLMQEYQKKCWQARYLYLKIKMAIADGDTLKKDETDSGIIDYDLFSIINIWGETDDNANITTNRGKITGLHGYFNRMLFMCRSIETTIEVVAQAVGIDNSPFKGPEMSEVENIAKSANKFFTVNKKHGVGWIKISGFDTELKTRINNARTLAANVTTNPDVIYEISSELGGDV
jgi:hypothetical protein